jgi:hypothetical protein
MTWASYATVIEISSIILTQDSSQLHGWGKEGEEWRGGGEQ